MTARRPVTRACAAASATAVLLLAAAPAAAQGDGEGRCRVLCAPDFKVEPTVTFENLGNRARVEAVGADGAGVGPPARQARESVFELILALGIPTELPRVGFTLEGRYYDPQGRLLPQLQWYPRLIREIHLANRTLHTVLVDDAIPDLRLRRVDLEHRSVFQAVNRQPGCSWGRPSGIPLVAAH